MGIGGRDREPGQMKSRAIFLDRDGVLNRPVIREGKSYPPARVEDLEIYEGLRDQLQRLKDRGFVLIVVTNQPDVARGTTPRETVEGINRVIAREIPAIDRFMVCFHDNGDGCDCRKPRPGMLLAGAAEFDIDLARSYMVGDRSSDVEAGIAAGSRTIFIDRAYREPPPTHCDHRVSSTLEALTIIESESEHEKS
jgi:D-glycero-D-manno-heptose 1,7-bisphosphate phosphatase